MGLRLTYMDENRGEWKPLRWNGRGYDDSNQFSLRCADGRIVANRNLPKIGDFLLVIRDRLSNGYCAGWGGTTAQPPLAPLTRVAIADWMDVSAAILGKVLIDSGVRTQSGRPSTS